jgi:hypothetical protein
MALYKYWKEFFPFPTTIITNTAISHRYFYYTDYRDSIEKPSQFMHNVVGSELVGIRVAYMIGFDCLSFLKFVQ